MLNSDNSSKDKCNNKEKMSIGELISYLRRTKGMTQKELGERLFVSDKTVSRWERGESSPELSLIPAIAGIFGITTDELLQGKLNDNSQNSEKNISRAVTNECELRAMLRNRARKYDNLSFISIGLTVLGILSAAICNIGLNEAYIGFFIAAAFISASEICQICFSSNAQSDTSGYDLCQSNIISESNMRFVKRGIYISIFNFSSLAFCLPLPVFCTYSNIGVSVDTWLFYGIIFAVVSLIISYLIYIIIVRDILIRKKKLIADDKIVERFKKDRKSLLKILSVSLIIAFIFVILIVTANSIMYNNIVEKKVFSSCEEFKKYVESQYDKWYEEYMSGDDFEYIGRPEILYDIVIIDPDSGGDGYDDEYMPSKVFGQIKDENGNMLCEYYYNPQLYHSILFNSQSSDKMPVTVITEIAHYNALDTVQTTESTLYFLIVLDFIVALCVYAIPKIFSKRSLHS